MIIEKGTQVLYKDEFWEVRKLKQGMATITRIKSKSTYGDNSLSVETMEEIRTVPANELMRAHFFNKYFFLLIDNQGTSKPFKSKKDIATFIKDKAGTKNYIFEVVNCHGEGIATIEQQLFR